MDILQHDWLSKAAISTAAATATVIAIHRLLSPPIPLLALGLPATFSPLPAIPSYILPFSPTLTWHWIRLSVHLKTWPWNLFKRVIPASSIDWESIDGPPEDTPILLWDRILVWKRADDCLPLRALKKWESLADPLADQALQALGGLDDEGKSKGDLTRKMQLALQDERLDEQSRQRLETYQAHIIRRPPRGAGVVPLQWYRERDRRRGKTPPAWLEQELAASFDELIPDEERSDDPLVHAHRLQALQEWQDDEWVSLTKEEQQEELDEEKRLIQEGQDTFYRYSGGILLSLLHFSLAGGFASPRLTGILKATGYLVPADRQKGKTGDDAKAAQGEGDKTWMRLMETTQWVLDVMETVDAIDPSSSSSNTGSVGGSGRHATLQVRFLHSRVRLRVAKLLPEGIVPLNQADLLSTLLSFSAAPLASLSRMGIDPSLEERASYLGLWRYIGWLMGVDDRLIRRCLQSNTSADRALTSCVLHLFDEASLKEQAAPTYKILKSISDRPPFKTTFALHTGLATSLVGPTLAQALQLPPTPLLVRLKVSTTYLGIYLTTLFGRWYTIGDSGWEKTRLSSTRRLLRRLIVWNLGMRRSQFQGSTKVAAPPLTDAQVRAGGKDSTTEKAEEDPGMIRIERNEPEAMKDVREYQWMIREMVAVYVVLGVATVGLVGPATWTLMT